MLQNLAREVAECIRLRAMQRCQHIWLRRHAGTPGDDRSCCPIDCACARGTNTSTDAAKTPTITTPHAPKVAIRIARLPSASRASAQITLPRADEQRKQRTIFLQPVWG